MVLSEHFQKRKLLLPLYKKQIPSSQFGYLQPKKQIKRKLLQLSEEKRTFNKHRLKKALVLFY